MTTACTVTWMTLFVRAQPEEVSQVGVERGGHDVPRPLGKLPLKLSAERVDQCVQILFAKRTVLDQSVEVKLCSVRFNDRLDDASVFVMFEIGFHTGRDALANVLMQRDDGVTLGVQFVQGFRKGSQVFKPFSHSDFPAAAQGVCHGPGVFR